MTTEREQIAAWMIQHGYTTGHGDAISDLLDGLEREVAGRCEMEIAAIGVHDVGHPGTAFKVQDMAMAAIRERFGIKGE